MCTHNKISHLKVLQRTTPDSLGALAFAQCTRTLCLPPTNFLFMWLQNKICFANVVGTQIMRFLIKMNHKISYLKGLQRTAPNRLGAQISTQCTRTLCQPPISFLMLWLQNKICFANVVGTQITRFSIKMNHKKSHLEGSHWTTPGESGTETFTQCTRTLCLTPNTFLSLWLRIKCITLLWQAHKNNKIFNQNEP